MTLSKLQENQSLNHISVYFISALIIVSLWTERHEFTEYAVSAALGSALKLGVMASAPRGAIVT
jgi:hypothetical protein